MDAPTKFVAEPSKSLKCPCCDGVFCEPVISIGCGHTFCKRCTQVSSDVDEEPHCPLDQTPFDGSSFVANRALQGQLDELQIYCRHGLMRFDSEEEFVIDETGCPEKIPVSHREEHEMICEYAWVPCPNNSNFCGKFRRKDMEEHLRQCDRHQCSFLSQGKRKTSFNALILCKVFRLFVCFGSWHDISYLLPKAAHLLELKLRLRSMSLFVNQGAGPWQNNHLMMQTYNLRYSPLFTFSHLRFQLDFTAKMGLLYVRVMNTHLSPTNLPSGC